MMDPPTDSQDIRIKFDCSVALAVVAEVEDPRAHPADICWLPNPVGRDIEDPAEKSRDHHSASRNVTRQMVLNQRPRPQGRWLWS
jgi:hypothetical protein